MGELDAMTNDRDELLAEVEELEEKVGVACVHSSHWHCCRGRLGLPVGRQAPCNLVFDLTTCKLLPARKAVQGQIGTSTAPRFHIGGPGAMFQVNPISTSTTHMEYFSRPSFLLFRYLNHGAYA